jgi:type II secretory pathway component GspD/PulD (secretin)
MKKLLAFALLASSVFAAAQTSGSVPVIAPPGPSVTISARGHDVRQVLADLFQQAKKSCVIERNISATLYLSLIDTPFDKALLIVCQQANLIADFKDGVYYIHRPVIRAKAKETPATVAPAPLPQKLPTTVLARHLTTRFRKTPLREVIEAFAEQTSVKLELDPQVPAYKLDAFLINTSLKYALDQVTKAAGLVYKFTDHGTIMISSEESKVALTE